MSELIVITYDKEQTGRDAFNELANLQKMQLLELEDAALAVKDDQGKVKVKQTLENQASGASALWGGFWGLLIGLIFLAPIFWGLFGALMGYIFGKATDIGIDNKFIEQVGDSLEPGGAALFMLSRAGRRCSCWSSRPRRTRCWSRCRNSAGKCTRPRCRTRTRRSSRRRWSTKT
jgi:uncharacterized membrane protein